MGCNEAALTSVDAAFFLSIAKLRDEGLTQAAIGERIGWSRDQVKNHCRSLDEIGTQVLDFAKNYQEGRVPMVGTIVPMTFTEGLFRNILSLTGVHRRP